jgi:hypothetical protein
MDDMDLEPPAPQPAAAQPAAAQPALGSVKLQPYWETNPAAWFSVAEGQFLVRGILDQHLRFYLAVQMIPEPVLRGLQDLLDAPPADCYDRLRARLLRRYTMSRYERMEALYQIKPLNGQQPSALLADLMQLCPAAERGTELFRFAFIHRLPRELRIILAQDEDSTLDELAEKADRMMSHHSSPFSTVAAIDEEPAAVAAVSSTRGRSSRGGRIGRGGRQQSRGGSRQQAGQQAGQPANQATMLEYPEGNPLCFYHWSYGATARKCNSPCIWSGN